MSTYLDDIITYGTAKFKVVKNITTENIKDLNLDSVPVGTIVPYIGNVNTLPNNFLFCDGSALSRKTYSDLFSIIGTTYGIGNGETTFNLPNLTGGEFLEGSSTAGTSKNAGLPNITGKVSRETESGNNYVAPFYILDNSEGAFRYSSGKTFGGLNPSGSYSQMVYSIDFDASRSSSIYGNSSTVQPKSVTVRYIIKVFNGQTVDSTLISIEQYVNTLNNKASKGLNNLTQTGEDHFLERDFCYIYPNNGTEQNPVNISINSRYVESNPFPGYIVKCDVEVLYNNQWGSAGWYTFELNGTGYARGVKTYMHDNNNIVIQTGNDSCLIAPSQVSGSSFGIGGNVGNQLPCRVKVWKIGKL